MTEVVFSGILAGIGFAFILGPAFFTLIQTSVDKGFVRGVYFASGIFLSDVTMVAVSFWGASKVFEIPLVSQIVGIAGGGILIGFGLDGLIKHRKSLKVKLEDAYVEKRIESKKIDKLPRKVLYLIKGFVLNVVNPANWIAWVFFVSLVSSNYSNETGLNLPRVIIFLSVTLLTIFAADVFKSYLAKFIKKMLNDKWLIRMNIGFGIILTVFGICLIGNIVSKLYF
ncbi:MAG: LysE family transporter [Bacteroidales bacterium]|nr:LysE family transporter [Bacteroidales bacterium]